MHNDHYAVVIHWEQDRDAYRAEVPQPPGCVASGPSRAETLTLIEKASAFWMRTAAEFHELVPQPQGRLPLVPLKAAMRS